MLLMLVGRCIFLVVELRSVEEEEFPIVFVRSGATERIRSKLKM
jgi:hypothetical protein